MRKIGESYDKTYTTSWPLDMQLRVRRKKGERSWGRERKKFHLREPEGQVSSRDGQVSKCRSWRECLEKMLRT